MSKFYTFTYLFIPLFILSACGESEPAAPTAKLPLEGNWLGQIALNDTVQLPFDFELKHTSDSTFGLTIINAEEQIEVEDIVKMGDSLVITMPVFATYFKVIATASEMRGVFVNPDKSDYTLPFYAQRGRHMRFPILDSYCCDVNEKWHAEFGLEGDRSDAIAYIEQNDSLLTATFETETGDYRYLEGVLNGNRLQLSAFDGAHLFLFDAVVASGQRIEGHFYSGPHFVEPWFAYRDDDFELRHADSLTYLVDGARFDFSFENISGKTVSLGDPQFENKAVVLQIMGSWCPNCMDESRMLSKLYPELNLDQIAIIAVAFERTKDKETALNRLEKLKSDLGIPYPILLGGSSREEDAASAFPSLNHVMSYPTLIFLNAEHEVVRIHTGFSGPSTPGYADFVAELKAFLNQLSKSQVQ